MPWPFIGYSFLTPNRRYQEGKIAHDGDGEQGELMLNNKGWHSLTWGKPGDKNQGPQLLVCMSCLLTVGDPMAAVTIPTIPAPVLQAEEIFPADRVPYGQQWSK